MKNARDYVYERYFQLEVGEGLICADVFDNWDCWMKIVYNLMQFNGESRENMTKAELIGPIEKINTIMTTLEY